jgi:hypothetical protein
VPDAVRCEDAPIRDRAVLEKGQRDPTRIAEERNSPPEQHRVNVQAHFIDDTGGHQGAGELTAAEDVEPYLTGSA